MLEPAWLVEQGIPENLITKHTRIYRSDWSSPKRMIFGPDGQVVDEIQAVYALDLLSSIASEFGLEARPCRGRGFQAREFQRVLREHLVVAAPAVASA